MSFQQVIISAFGGPEVLKVIEQADLPEPSAGQVRVKVLAAGTGFTDTIIRQGQYYDVKVKPPFVLGYDWFGVVDKLGPGVTNLTEGQFVADMSIIGGYTQYLCADANRVVPAPEGLDPAEAVAMILSYTTAYQMLTRIRHLPAGTTCLVHAAGGAVGTALIELGKMMGFVMYGTASQSKHILVKQLGGIPIDYKAGNFADAIHSLTYGVGVDVVFDTIGGENWSRSYRCLKNYGLLVGFGALKLTTGEEKLPTLLLGFFKLLFGWKLVPDGKQTRFYNIQRRREKFPDQFKQDVQTLFGLLQEGKLRPAIAARESLEQAAEVHKKIDNADIAGKIVLIC